MKYARVNSLNPETENIIDRFAMLDGIWDDESIDVTAEKFGKLSCYCYDSVPGSHAFFLQNPRSIHSLYNVVNAGGDTDSTGSMVGSLLGAYNGVSIFPQKLIDGLDKKDEIIALAEKLCDKIGIK